MQKSKKEENSSRAKNHTSTQGGFKKTKNKNKNKSFRYVLNFTCGQLAQKGVFCSKIIPYIKLYSCEDLIF